ncbi:MAG: nucleotidyltransferase domain-containing protein [Brevinematia bacterium]
MKKKINKRLFQIKNHLLNIYGEKIREVILYGSYARKKYTKNSDIDILVLTDISLNPSEVRKSLSDLLLDILIEDEELVSVIIIPENTFKNYNYPFVKNVKKDGIRI